MVDWPLENRGMFPIAIGILEISVAGPFFPRFWQFGILETKMLLGNSGPLFKGWNGDFQRSRIKVICAVG